MVLHTALKQKTKDALEEFVLICATPAGFMEFLEIQEIVEPVTYVLSMSPIVGAPGPDSGTWDSTNPDDSLQYKSGCPRSGFSDLGIHQRSGTIYSQFMTEGLVRHQNTGEMHFLTFSCYHRLPYLAAPETRDLFESALEKTRQKYKFVVAGHVVMPEHVHLLVNEPAVGALDQAIKSVKLSVTLRTRERPFWQTRYYDFNVFTEEKRVEKLRYMHRNPVARGLVNKPEDWPWSSFRHYSTGMEGTVEIESFWTGWRRDHGTLSSQVPEAAPGAP
jgi:putative transposase